MCSRKFRFHDLTMYHYVNQVAHQGGEFSLPGARAPLGFIRPKQSIMDDAEVQFDTFVNYNRTQQLLRPS